MAARTTEARCDTWFTKKRIKTFLWLIAVVFCAPLSEGVQADDRSRLCALKLVIVRDTPLREGLTRWESSHRWFISGAPHGEGIIYFVRDPTHKTLRVWDYRGMKNQTGVGAYLIDELRRSFPDYQLTGSLGLLNFNRAREAFLNDPQDPDIQQIPLFKDLRASVFFGPDLDQFDPLDGASLNFVISALNFSPATASLFEWKDREALLSHPRYRDWIEYLEAENDEDS